MRKPEFVYVTYIETTPEKLWEALTSSEFSERYWWGTKVLSNWKVGSPFALEWRGKVTDTGVIVEADPPRRLAYSFRAAHAGMEAEPPSRVTFELEPQRDQVKLTVVHDKFEPGSKAFESVSRGWPLVLSSLKSYLETGKVLYAPWYEDAQQGAA